MTACDPKRPAEETVIFRKTLIAIALLTTAVVFGQDATAVLRLECEGEYSDSDKGRRTVSSDGFTLVIKRLSDGGVSINRVNEDVLYEGLMTKSQISVFLKTDQAGIVLSRALLVDLESMRFKEIIISGHSGEVYVGACTIADDSTKKQ